MNGILQRSNGYFTTLRSQGTGPELRSLTLSRTVFSAASAQNTLSFTFTEKLELKHMYIITPISYEPAQDTRKIWNRALLLLASAYQIWNSNIDI